MNIDQAAAILKTFILADIPTFLWGVPGCGKSDLVAQTAHALGYGLVDYRLNTLETVDLRGLPRAADNGRDVVWLKPDLFVELEEYGDRPVILFLDEWNTSNPSMMAVSMQLTLSRRIGPHRLGRNVRLVGAGNRQGDKAAAQKMPTALANRLAHLDIAPDHKAWRKWAIKAGINPALVAYLDFKPSALHDMKGDDLRAFPTPRAWAQVNKILDTATAKGPTIRALVGEGAMNEVMAFMRMWEKMPDIDNLIANPKKAQVPPEKEPAILYAVASALSFRADASNIAAIMSYAERLPRDFARLCMASIEQKTPSLKKHPAMMAWEAGQGLKHEDDSGDDMAPGTSSGKPIVFPDWSDKSSNDVAKAYARMAATPQEKADKFISCADSHYLWGFKAKQGPRDSDDIKRIEAAKLGIWPHWSFKQKIDAIKAVKDTTGMVLSDAITFVNDNDWLIQR